MVQWVTMLDAEVLATAFTGQFHHFPLPAARAFTLIGEDLTFLLCWIRATVSVNVLPHSAVRGLPSGHRHRHIAEWAYRYLDILLVSRSTVMLSIGHMVCTEDARAGVALERQKIQALTARLRTVSPEVRKLHGPAGQGLPSHCASQPEDPTPPQQRRGALTSSRRAGSSRAAAGRRGSVPRSRAPPVAAPVGWGRDWSCAPLSSAEGGRTLEGASRRCVGREG